MTNAIVSGANGFLGKSLCSELLQRGYEVYGLVKTARYNTNHDRKEYHELVYTNDIHLDLIELGKKPTIFFHFAWNGVSDKLASNYQAQFKNFEYSVELMKLASRLGCIRFVFAGSIFEYENFVDKSTIFDSSSLNKTYSYFKNLTDNYLSTYAQQLDLQYVSCIISNVFGPNEKSSRFITSLINRMYDNREFAISECKQQYDFIYIDDAIAEIILCAEKGLSNNRYYIGSGNIKPLKEYIEEIKSIVNPTYRLEFGKAKGMPTLFDFSELDVSRIKRELGYNCKYSFSEGVKLVMKSIKEKK